MADVDWHNQIPDLTHAAEEGEGCKLRQTFALIPTFDDRLQFLTEIRKQNKQDRLEDSNVPLLSPWANMNLGYVEMGLVKGQLWQILPTDRANSLIKEYDTVSYDFSVDGIERTVDCKDIKSR
jgi:hypothetical protein